jgi:hypothetical protein
MTAGVADDAVPADQIEAEGRLSTCVRDSCLKDRKKACGAEPIHEPLSYRICGINTPRVSAGITTGESSLL